MQLTKNILIVCVIVATGHGVVVLEENRVTFDRRENDLAWPLGDVTDPGLLMLHGQHCFELVQQPVNRTDNMSIIHYEHCRSVVAGIYHLLVTNPSYHVPDWICKTLIGDRKRRLSGRGLLNNCIFCNYNLWGRKKRDTFGVPRSDMTQSNYYASLAGYNFGQLLKKKATESTSFNNVERIYLQAFGSRSATVMGAVSVYCSVKGNLEEIRLATI